MKAKYVFTLMMVACAFTQNSIAQQTAFATDQWVLVGNSRADYTLDHDIVSINEGDGNVTALKFMIRQGTLTMHQCTVHFTNGESQDVLFTEEANYSENGVTLNIDDSNKIVYKVSFWYDTQNNSDKKSIVEIWAIHRNQISPIGLTSQKFGSR